MFFFRFDIVTDKLHILSVREHNMRVFWELKKMWIYERKESTINIIRIAVGIILLSILYLIYGSSTAPVWIV